MKDFHKALYIFSIVLFLTVILGGTLTKPVFKSIAERNLDRTMIRKSSIDSLDDRIDETLYKVTKIQLQIDKIKNIFSSDEIDESKYQKEKHLVFQNNIYNPLLEVLIFFYRGILLVISLFTLMSAVILHMKNNTNSIRNKLKNLEEKIAILEAASK